MREVREKIVANPTNEQQLYREISHGLALQSLVRVGLS